MELRSPLRFKVQGKYTKDFEAQDFMRCLFRRAKTMCLMYGSASTDSLYSENNSIQIIERNLKWKDQVHYSARQKKAMELGGALGAFKMSGIFTEVDLALFDFAKIANCGKNTIFGLGQMDWWGKLSEVKE